MPSSLRRRRMLAPLVCLLGFLTAPGVSHGQSQAFRRGDSNADGRSDISDGVFSLGFLFLGSAEAACRDAADANDDGKLDIADPVFSFGFLFLGGPPPPAPGPDDCGADPTLDPLDCASHPACTSPPETPPGAVFEFSPLGGDAPLEVTFDASESFAAEGSIAEYEWDFGDGGSGSGRIVRHTFLEPGRYEIALVVVDDGGSRAAATRVLIVSACRPQPPLLDPYDRLTREDSVAIRGRAEPGSTVEVTGPLGRFSVPADGGAFAATVPLAPLGRNRGNEISFRADEGCGSLSSPVTASVTHDAEAPLLFIDFPAAGSEIGTETTDVAGRVADRLSGFLGLTVLVNGMPALVDPGIGTNGTFVVQGLPLAAQGPTRIEAVASDALGNVARREIGVSRPPAGEGEPRLAAVSGNGQSGAIRSRLPEPLVVRLTRADGAPFAGKLVTFRVTRSDGRLAADAAGAGSLSLQARTDDQGLARACWQLGTDAGCGNNRVEVESRSVAGAAFFCASATPGPASQINVGSSGSQRGEAGGPAPSPLRVRVSDGCNGIAGVAVTFTVVRGGGQVDGGANAVAVTGGTGHAEAALTLGPERGNNVVSATFAGNPGAPAVFTVYGVPRGDEGQTSFSGFVIDNGGRPIQGAICRLAAGPGEFPSTRSGLDGQFRFDALAGSGPAQLFVDGGAATRVGGAGGVDVAPGSFPALRFALDLVPRADNALPAPVVLPPLDPQNARIYDGTRDVELTVDGVEGLSMLVKAGSMRLPGGVVPGPENPAVLSLNQVHHDDVPMPMPDGAAPPFAWTLQPAGAAFDPPIQVRYPNMSGLAPGAVAYFLSFDHDTDRFEIVASGHVVADGSSIVTDPGAGLDKAGWGCNCPPYSITGDCDACPEGDGAGASNQDRCRPCRKEDKVTPGKNGSPGAAQTSPNRSEITYRVGGTTLTEVLANMLSGPNAPHAAKTSCQFPGSTPEAEVRGKKLSDGGRGHYWEVELTVKRFEIQADIEVSLPDWTGRSGDTCRQRTDEWDRFLGKLRAHEERHVDLCKASLERRGKEVMALKLTAVSCDFNQALKLLADAFNAALQRITAAEDQRLQKDHDDFDRQTNHGNTPGDAHLDTSKDASCPP